MIYVTYDKTSGLLTGAYVQELLPEHADCYVEVTQDQLDNWVHLKFNLETAALEPYTPAPTPAPVPQEVTMRQARLALLSKGMLDQVATAISNLTSPQKEEAQIEWDYSSTVIRSHNMTKLIGQALGLTDAQLDDLFTLAATL